MDENWKLAQNLPTAVDDDGSLANYVSVPLPSGPSAPASPPPPSLGRPAHQISFWSQTSDAGVCTPFGDEGWTSVVPPGLIAAAREEEVFLANGAVGTTPNIPPAPVLPRHLDKLILNARIGATAPTPAKERRHRTRTRHGELGMTRPNQDEPPPPVPPRIPVTTASGTDVSAARHGHSNSYSNSPVRTLVGGSTAPLGTTAAALMLADDASVLPVPSHVVLHHLSTSAIRNGVLAVGNTTRYKKKVRSFPGLDPHSTLTIIYPLFPSSSLQRSTTSQRDRTSRQLSQNPKPCIRTRLVVDGAIRIIDHRSGGSTLFFFNFSLLLSFAVLFHPFTCADAYDLDDVDVLLSCPARACATPVHLPPFFCLAVIHDVL